MMNQFDIESSIRLHILFLFLFVDPKFYDL